MSIVFFSKVWMILMNDHEYTAKVVSSFIEIPVLLSVRTKVYFLHIPILTLYDLA